MIHKYRLGSLPSDKNTGWRAYQKSLKRHSKKRRRRQRLPLWQLLVLVIGVVICVGYGASITGVWPGNISALGIDRNKDITSNSRADHPSPKALDQQALRYMLADIKPSRLTASTFSLEKDGAHYQIKTTIDNKLQNALVDKLHLEHARYLGIVVLNPDTGRILSMINHDRSDPDHNICVDNRFPAASIIKIVTASAAIETCNLEPDSTMTYNGRKYTLYKSQLKDKQNKYTRRIALKDAFAQSINPVFGKLGANRLGGETLVSYAEAFGFNHKFNLVFKMAPSRFTASDTPYQWAELACGFNQETTLSPLHGAMIAAAIVNGGKLIEPSFIDSVTNEAGKIVYQGHARTVQEAIETRTAQVLSAFMRITIRKGTAKKMFRGYRKDRVLSRLDLGGKTGSINNDPRYDWFVGFAKDKTSGQSVVVSALVAHEKFIGIKSGQYARMAIKAFFKDYFAKQSTPTPSTVENTKKG
jgi:cell division protein FtsI/penicillin-binding protein 2